MSEKRLSIITNLLSVLALGTLFLPFATSALLAAIFAFAILGANDKFKSLNQTKKYLLYGIISSIGIAFTVTLFSIVNLIIANLRIISDPASLEVLKQKILELYSPTLILIKKNIGRLLTQSDQIETIQNAWNESLNGILDSALKLILSWVTKIPSNTLQLFFFVFFFIFLLLKLKSPILSQNPTILLIFQNAKQSGFATIITMTVSAFAQAFVLTSGAVIVGIGLWPIVFVSTIFSAMIPIVGVLPVGIACTIYASSELSPNKSIVMLLFLIGASLIDNVVKPVFMAGDDTNLNPILCFFALIGALIIFGFSGIFIGPFIIQFTSQIYSKFQNKIKPDPILDQATGK